MSVESPRRRQCFAYILISIPAMLLMRPASALMHAYAGTCPQVDLTAQLPQFPDDPRMLISADHVESVQGGLSNLHGSVFVRQAGREFKGEDINFDQTLRELRANSLSLFRDHDMIVVQSEKARYSLLTNTGVFDQVIFSLPRRAARGTSSRVMLARAGTAELTRGTYTTCAPGQEDWKLTGSRIDLDQNTGIGVARNATIRIDDVPVLWLPYFRFPINNDRQSGFLEPLIGNSNTTGFDIRWPYYFNLAPNYDLTLTPRYMSNRGDQIQGNFRYLFEHSEGLIHGEYLPSDEETHADRSFIDVSHQTLINPRLAFDVQYAQVSDINYFSDLGAGDFYRARQSSNNGSGVNGGLSAFNDIESNYDITTTPYLTRAAEFIYQAPTQYRLKALFENDQPLAGLGPQDTPYKRLPELNIEAETKNRLFDTAAGFNGDFTDFQRSDSVAGERTELRPYLRWEQDHASWFATAESDFSYTRYDLTGAGSLPNVDTRALPIISGDTGVRFERITGDELQTLVPRLFYLYVPYRNQSQIPVFDTGLPDFDFPQLFATNRYSGEDRISDANQLTAAVTTQLLDPDTGEQELSASLGDIYRFTAPRVTLPGEDSLDRGTSDYVGELTYTLSRHWNAQSTLQWSPDQGRFERGSVILHYRGDQTRFDIAYRYLDGVLNQADVDFATPIIGRFQFAGRLQYSITDSQLVDSFAGIGYETCCWAVRTTYRRSLTNINGEYSNGVYFQFELKGLSRLGSSFLNLLPRNDDF